jgi:hypothetical protein
MQPLPQDAAKAFEAWKVSKNAKDTDKVFNTLTVNHRPSEMIRVDLEAADLPTEDRAGNPICFHSLRNSYITFLANSNTPAKVVQQLARHSSINLTMNTYARVAAYNEQTAIESLPKLTDKEKNQQQQRATGTTGKSENFSYTKSYTKVAPDGDYLRTTANIETENKAITPEAKNPANDSKNAVFNTTRGANPVMGRGGLEPPTHGFSVRCRKNTNADKANTYEQSNTAQIPNLTTQRAPKQLKEQHIDPDLRQVITAWAGLAEHIKQTILTLTRS